MRDSIEEFIKDQLDITTDTHFEFQNLFGFTFVVQRKILTVRENISSAEIKPVAIIYEENDEFYLAPLDEVDKIEPIIKEFVENCMK